MNDDLTPSEIGARAEAAVARALVEAGKTVLFPIHGAHLRYDLVYEDPQGFHRVQCKTARLMKGAVFFAVCSNTNNIPEDYEGQIDVFGVYCPAIDEVYFVRIEDVPCRRYMSLRVEAPRNNQRKGIHWARDYRIVSEERASYDAAPSARRRRRNGDPDCLTHILQPAAAASSLDNPSAIAFQNRWRYSRRPTGGRPGERIAGRPARSDRRRFCCPIATPRPRGVATTP